VPRLRDLVCVLAMGACGSVLTYRPARADGAKGTTQQSGPAGVDKLVVTVGKSMIIDSPLPILRVSVANETLAETVAVDPKQVLINGKAPGETSLIVWQRDGARMVYDLTVRMSPIKLDAVRQQIARDFPKEDINITFENDTAFVRGTVKDVVAAERVMSMAATLGKVVNLLRVEVPPVEAQVLLKVRFASVDRSTAFNLSLGFATGAFNTQAAIGTGGPISSPSGTTPFNQQSFSLSDAMNIFLFRKDLNLIAGIQALETKGLAEVLAEPNVLAINGKQASFVAGGEFPFPMVQGGTAVGTVTIQWKEYGIRLNFLPTVTPRGTIRLEVAPEVSALDYSNAVTISGFTVPALTTRRVQTEVELDSGQSFVIAGLLNNQVTESLSKIPGIGDIPLLGKLFQGKTLNKSNTELLVIVTPELVRPIPAAQPQPTLNMPLPYMTGNTNIPMQQPGLQQTGPVPVKPVVDTLPAEELMQQRRQGQAAPAANTPQFQLVPIPLNPASPSPNQGLTPANPVNPNGGGK
jgi:pilus assembly protein CpaC